MMMECQNCFPPETRHSIKWIRGDKESYYEIRCCKCKRTGLVASYIIEELKRNVATEKE
jgi:hypothetical protein